MNPEGATTTPTISAWWTPELRDIKDMFRLGGVPRNLTLLLVATSLIGLVLTIGLGRFHAWRQVSVLLMMTPPVVLLCFSVIIAVLLPRQAWRLHPGAKRPTTCEITSEGITLKQDAMTSSYGWGAIVLAVEGKSVFVLHVSTAVLTTPVVVPKRALSPEGVAATRDLLANHATRFRRRTAAG